MKGMKHEIYEFICELLLLLILVLFGCYLILIGSNILNYSNACSEEIYDTVKTVYVTNKVRENDRADLIEATGNKLAFSYEESDYVNYVYEYEGDLCELLVDVNDGVNFGLGSHVLDDIDFNVKKVKSGDGHNDSIVYNINGISHRVSLRSGRQYSVR